MASLEGTGWTMEVLRHPANGTAEAENPSLRPANVLQTISAPATRQRPGARHRRWTFDAGATLLAVALDSKFSLACFEGRGGLGGINKTGAGTESCGLRSFRAHFPWELGFGGGEERRLSH